MVELLGGADITAHQLDPSGERPLKVAKELRRRVLRDGGRRNSARLRDRRAGALRPARPAAVVLAPRRRPAALARPGERRAVAARARERRPLNPDEVVRRLGLRPHPEGGFYGETFRSPLRLTLPDGRDAQRLHRHPLSPAARRLEHLAPGRARTRSGTTTTAGALLLYRLGLRAGAARPRRRRRRWFPRACGRRRSPRREAVLCGCTVAPGFEFEDFEIGSAAALAAEFPAEAALIRRLGR